MAPTRLRTLASAVLVAVALTACNGAGGMTEEEALADWCERTETWIAGFFELEVQHRQDPASVSETELEELEELRVEMIADPVPNEVEPAAETLRDIDALAAQPWEASETVLEASEELLGHAVEVCDLDVEGLVGE